MIVKVKALNNAIANVSRAICKDYNRPIFQCMHIYTDDIRKTIIFEAVDGYKCCTTEIEVEEDFSNFDVLVKGVEKVKTKNNIITIKYENAKLQIGNTYYEDYKVTENYGDFMNTKEVFKGERNFKFAIDPRLFESAIKELYFKNKHGFVEPVIVEMNTNNVTSPIIVRCKNSKNLVAPRRLPKEEE